MIRCDILIVGAGIAGASAGYFLADHGSVCVIEGEDQPGYHTTGRSAAFFVESYGNAHIRPLTRASKALFLAPPEGFTDTPLLRERGALYIARADQRARLERFATELAGTVAGLVRRTADQIRAQVPCLRDGYAVAGLYEGQARDIDVHALHQGFLTGLRARGGEIRTGAYLRALTRRQGRWQAETSAGPITANVVVNAAGAWGDEVAELAGTAAIGLTPMRRTIIIVPAPTGIETRDWPLVVDVDEQFYFKPESGHILASPADETPMAPCDVQPEEIDVARAVDRLQKATNLDIPRILRRWAGLRTFAPDRVPVVGWDRQVRDFFWFVGQGGYGMQTAPAMGRLIAGLLVRGEVPDALAKEAVSAAAYDPVRFS